METHGVFNDTMFASMFDANIKTGRCAESGQPSSQCCRDDTLAGHLAEAVGGPCSLSADCELRLRLPTTVFLSHAIALPQRVHCSQSTYSLCD